MYLRCAKCNETIWIQSLGTGAAAVSAACAACGKRYRIETAGELGATGKEQYARANEYAKTHGVDLPTAYSALLGILSLEESKEADRKATEQSLRARRTEERADSGDDLTLQPDPAAKRPSPEPQPAVSDDLEAAMREAMRAAEAEEAAQTAGRVATPVATASPSRRPSPQQARFARRRRPAPGERVDVPLYAPKKKEPVSKLQLTLMLVMSVAILAAVFFYGRGKWNEIVEQDRAATTNSERAFEQAERLAVERQAQEEKPAPRKVRAKVEKDPKGRVIQIVGSDPTSVLLAYCDSMDAKGRFEPVELTSTVPPFSGARLGVYRDLEALNQLAAIRIRKDRRSHKWIAGNGDKPVLGGPLPMLPADAIRIPVTPN